MKSKIVKIIMFPILTILLTACISVEKENSLTLRKTSIFNDKDIVLPAKIIKK